MEGCGLSAEKGIGYYGIGQKGLRKQMAGARKAVGRSAAEVERSESGLVRSLDVRARLRTSTHHSTFCEKQQIAVQKIAVRETLFQQQTEAVHGPEEQRKHFELP